MRQNQEQVQLQQRPGKQQLVHQQGYIQQNHQRVIFQTEKVPHLVVFRKSQSQQEFFKGKRQKELAKKRQFQQDQPRSQFIQRQTQFQQCHPRSQFVQRQTQLEQDQQKSQFFQQKP